MFWIYWIRIELRQQRTHISYCQMRLQIFQDDGLIKLIGLFNELGLSFESGEHMFLDPSYELGLILFSCLISLVAGNPLLGITFPASSLLLGATYSRPVFSPTY